MKPTADDALRSLLEIAREVRAPTTTLGQEARAGLTATLPLSEAGIELALTEHLETSATDAELASLKRACGAERGAPARRCHVVLSAHVCTAALRAIAIALVRARGPVSVKASRRDPTLARIFVRELGRRAVAITEEGSLPEGLGTGDEVHVYGSNVAIAAVESGLPAGVACWSHGPGFGIAVVSAEADIEEAARDLARDVVPFDQRGCLSPRVAFVGGGSERVETFARALHEALTNLATRVPRGEIFDDERAGLARVRATFEAIGGALEDRDHLVAFADRLDGLVVPPAARAVVVTSMEPFANRAGWARAVTTIGSPALAAPLQGSCAAPGAEFSVPSPDLEHVRLARLGYMQRPPLDGPVDMRTLAPQVG